MCKNAANNEQCIAKMSLISRLLLMQALGQLQIATSAAVSVTLAEPSTGYTNVVSYVHMFAHCSLVIWIDR